MIWGLQYRVWGSPLYHSRLKEGLDLNEVSSSSVLLSSLELSETQVYES